MRSAPLCAPTCRLRLAALLLFAAATAAPGAADSGGRSTPPLLRCADFRTEGPSGASIPGWETWSPRAELRPRFRVEPTGGRSGSALAIHGAGNPAAVGAWRRIVPGVRPGRAVRLTVYYRARGIPFEARSLFARLDWLASDGRRVRPPDYALADPAPGTDGWTRVAHTAPVPEGAHAVAVELGLAWAPQGEVRWDDLLLEETAPRRRVVRVLTVAHRPRGARSAAESLEAFCRLVESTADRRPDLVCLPEGVTVVGTGKSYADVAEPVPGPSTERLGRLARRLRSYVVAGIYERAGRCIYNTAVLLDREGRLAGRYRKTHLPREEVEGGLTPGDAYPVFDTDFGRIGVMICWDLQFPEPARALALQGAEVILLPIWGGSEILARARAIENHVYLVTASYDMRTFVVDPAGEVLAEATEAAPIASAEIDLDRKIVQPWLGDMKARTWKERRPDLPVFVAPGRPSPPAAGLVPAPGRRSAPRGG